MRTMTTTTRVIGRSAWQSPVTVAATVLVVAGIAGACGSEAPRDAWGGSVDSLPGGGVRVVSPAQGLWTPETTWRLEESLRIGSLEGSGPDLFGSIGDVDVDAEGRIYVLETQAHEIRVFGADGAHLRTIGRQGQGPGELNVRFGGGILIDTGGRVWVDDAMNRRWDLFTAEGEFVTSTPQTSTFFGGSLVKGRDGAFYKTDQVRPSGGDARRVVVRLEVQGDSLVATDTIDVPRLPDAEVISVSMSTSAGASISMSVPVPFVQTPSWTYDPAGYFWVNPGDGYRLVALSPELDTLRIVERAFEPIPVTAAELDEAVEDLTTQLEGSDARVDRSRIPDHHPAFSRWRTDPAGHLWVGRTLGTDRWVLDVFDPDGRYLGEVATDIDLAAFNISLITADAVYGVLRGELDEPYVVRLAIVKGG